MDVNSCLVASRIIRAEIRGMDVIWTWSELSFLSFSSFENDIQRKLQSIQKVHPWSEVFHISSTLMSRVFVPELCWMSEEQCKFISITDRAPVWIPYATGVMSSMWCDQAGHAQDPTVIVESGSSDAQPAAQQLFWTGGRSAGLKRVTANSRC